MDNSGRLTFPEKNVILYDKPIRRYVLKENTKYQSIFNTEEQKRLLDRIKYKYRNTPCVRLDKIDDGTAYMSIVHFEDFLTSNAALSIKDGDADNLFLLKRKLVQNITCRSNGTEFTDILDISALSGIIAISVILEDVEGNLLIIERSPYAVVASSMFSVAVTGTVTEKDSLATNPALGAAKRTVREKLSLTLDLKFEGFAMSRFKLQPVALFSGKIFERFSQVAEMMKMATDYRAESSSAYVVPKYHGIALIRSLVFSDISSYQLQTTCGINEYTYKDKPLGSFDIKDYRLW